MNGSQPHNFKQQKLTAEIAKCIPASETQRNLIICCLGIHKYFVNTE